MKKIPQIFLGLAIIFIVGVLGTAFYAVQQLQPSNTQRQEKVTFMIPRGQSISVIGRRLQDQGLIRNAVAFRYVVWQQQLTDKIQAGSFVLSPSMSVDEIAHQLTTGTNDLWVTILEGWRVEEIADTLAAQNLDNFDKQEFLNLAKYEEGYLFPDSYLVSRNASAVTVNTLFRNTFDKKVKEGLAPEIAQSGQSLQNIIILASIVQREAREFDQMKQVAGILQNRLNRGMGLYVDATMQYAKGYDENLKTWWPEPLAIDRESNSQFNTYKSVGLPPHPISNPGLEAIRAVLAPQKSNDLYYIHDRQGNIHTAATLEQHNKNINTYLR